MYKLVNATYNEEKLLLDEKLDINKEGKKLNIAIFNDEYIDKANDKIIDDFFDNYNYDLSKYKFNREEANER